MAVRVAARRGTGGVISTDPSDRSRRRRRDAAGARPQRGERPRHHAERGSSAGRPAAARPGRWRSQAGQRRRRPQRAHRPRGTPRVRVPETPQQGGSDTRPGAASRSRIARRRAKAAGRRRNNRQADDKNDGSSRTRQPRQDEGDRNDEVRSRRPEAGSPGGSPRPSRPESETPAVRRPDPPRSYDAPRNRGPGA